jgi:hypothetical protein
MVLRGSVRLVAGLATRRRDVTAEELAGADRAEWVRVRAELDERRQRRVERRRFRRDPKEYLKALKKHANPVKSDSLVFSSPFEHAAEPVDEAVEHPADRLASGKRTRTIQAPLARRRGPLGP